MSNDTDRNLTAGAVTSMTTPAGTAAAPIVTDEPNLPVAILGGLVAALAGALVWALITVTTKFQIGFMAVGVGFLVAWTVRTFGKGHTQVFGVIGGSCALLGCLLGNLLSACGFIAQQNSAPVVDVTLKVLGSPAFVASILQETFNGMDLLFYAIAVYEGYKLARRPPR
jgi:hypothetical protein